MTNLVINLHLLEQCNYHCRHCFGHFDVSRPLSLSCWKEVVDNIAENKRVARFNLAGGEPLLFPKLGELAEYIHGKGAAVSIITNGSLLQNEMLQTGTICMIGISIDSFREETLRQMGRCRENGAVLSQTEYRRLCDMVKENGIDLKINTVVTRLNLNDDFSAVKEIAPKRWKILKMQSFKNGTFDNSAFGISDEEFARFCGRQKELGIGFIPEDTTQNAYIFIDPAGNLVDNTGGNNTPAGNLLKEDFVRCLENLPFNKALYNSRYIVD